MFTTDTFLAQRWENEGGGSLYDLPDEGRGYVAEVGVDEGSQEAFVVRSFSSNVSLRDNEQV